MAAKLNYLHFKYIFFHEKFRISNEIPLKYVPLSLIDNNSSLVSAMTWHQTGDTLLSEPMNV